MLIQSDRSKELFSRLIASNEVKEKYSNVIKNPKNISLLTNGIAPMWSLLEKANSYNEDQYEFIFDEELENYLTKFYRPEGCISLWFEEDTYFYLSEVQSLESRDLKIRKTYDMQDKLITIRLIYKIKADGDTFIIRSVNFIDAIIFDLFQETVFKGYEKNVVKSITNPYQFKSDELKIIIKRYSKKQRTLMIEGQKFKTLEWIHKAEKELNKKLQSVKKHQRDFAPEIQGEFDKTLLMGDEYQKCGRYFHYEN